MRIVLRPTVGLMTLCLTIAAAGAADSEGYWGDRVFFRVDLLATKIEAVGGKRLGEICVPAGTQVIGTRPAQENGKPRFVVFETATDCRDSSAIRKGTLIEVDSAATVEQALPNTLGFSWGVLAVPFKYQLTGDQEVSGEATVGSYLGYRFQDALFGYGVTPIVFLGAAPIEIEGSDDKLFAISYGAGLQVGLFERVNVGAVVGFDHVNESSGYEYNDKPWAALQLSVPIQ